MQFFKGDRDQCHVLSQIIMQLSGDPAALFLLCGNKTSAQIQKRLFHCLPVSNVQTRANESKKCAICFEARHAPIEHPAILAIETPQSIFHVEFASCAERFGIDSKASVQIV